MLKRRGRGRDGPPVVSDKDVREIIARLKAGKSSLKAEAQRIGCYHATVRRSVREVLGSEEAYAKLMGGRRRNWRARGTSTTPSQGRAKTTPLPVVDDPSRCKRCDAVLKFGTNGNGFVTAWCVCGFRER